MARWLNKLNILARLRAIAPVADSAFNFGPDQPEGDADLRFRRPYFLLTLPTQNPAAGQPGARDETGTEFCDRVIGATQRLPHDKKITDLFIMSHGWHRNFFGAVAAYDRLVGRIVLLRQSQRLPLLPASPTADEQQETARQVGAEKQFHPLFVCLHWHSDPGQDRWADGLGRRHKDSFINNARNRFAWAEGNDARFVRDFECLFELMSQMSAPGKDAFSDRNTNRRAPLVTRCLSEIDNGQPLYRLRIAPEASLAEKIAVLWTCYHEAEARGAVTDQTAPRRAYLTPWEALVNLVKFVVGVLGIAAVAGAVLPKLFSGLSVLGWLVGIKDALIREHLQFFTRNLWELRDWFKGLLWMPQFWWWGSAFAVSILVLVLAACHKQMGEKRRQDEKQKADSAEDQAYIPAAHAWPSFVVAPCWLVAQVFCLAPALIFVLVFYFLGGLTATVRDAFSRKFRQQAPGFERLGIRGRAYTKGVEGGAYVKEHGLYSPFLYWFIAWARFPSELARLALAADSSVASLIASVDGVLAFFDMQGRGVESGVRAARYLRPLLAHFKEQNPGVRVHLLGHSFGGLVVCNMARELAYGEAATSRIDSLSVIQGAISSNWFEWEGPMLDKIRLIANIYSRYDSANSFYYPIANQGRCAAGYLGFADVPKVVAPKQPDDYLRPAPRGRYAALVRPPFNLGITLKNGTVTAVNFDASRLIYGGSLASGGGHSLIYKDDVVHLLWSVVRLTWLDKNTGNISNSASLGNADPGGN